MTRASRNRHAALRLRARQPRAIRGLAGPVL